MFVANKSKLNSCQRSQNVCILKLMVCIGLCFLTAIIFPFLFFILIFFWGKNCIGVSHHPHGIVNSNAKFTAKEFQDYDVPASLLT